jgi:adenosylcobinamide-phosphate synthase
VTRRGGTSGAPVLLGWVGDRVLGEPPARFHPVAWFGTAMSALERVTYRPSRAAGTAHTAVGVAGGVLAGVVAGRVVGRPAATAVATTVSVAGRMLGAEATAVLDAVERGELATARTRAASLVGRDRDALDDAELVRAVVESLAENLVDAVAAPLFWAAVGGAPAVLAHRAVNTLDAMVGHRDERYGSFGWAAARLDDAANFVPARLAAATVAVVAPRRARAVWTAVRRDAPAHPSPNAGVIEAALAAALGVRLGGTNRYGDRVEDRGTMGVGPAPTVADGRRAVALTAVVGGVFAGATAVVRSAARPCHAGRSRRR